MNRCRRCDKPDWVPPRSVKLLEQVRERARDLHCSLQAEKAYVHWAKVFVSWVGRSHDEFRRPREMGQGQQELLEHADVSTTMIHTHMLKVAAGATASPLNAMPFEN